MSPANPVTPVTARDPASPALSWPPRPPRHVAGLPAGLLVCWQVALLVALVAIGRPTGHVVALGIGAAAFIAATGVRVHGRRAHEWLVLWLRYLLRVTRVADLRQPPELALLGLATRTESVTIVEVEGAETAVISHADGYTAVMALACDELDANAPQLPLRLAPPSEPEAPEVSVQLLVHTGGSARHAWFAVRVHRDPRFLADELQAALVSAVRRLQRRLRSERLTARPLDRAGLRAALRSVTFLDLSQPPGPHTPIGTEQWRTWWTGTVPQESLAIRAWPDLSGQPGAAVAQALLGSGPLRTVTVAARRLQATAAPGAVQAGAGIVAVEMLVRLAAPDRAALAATVGQVRDDLMAAGAAVERLDGRQLPGFAATLPLGGFLSGYPPAGGAHPPPPGNRPAPTPRESTLGAPLAHPTPPVVVARATPVPPASPPVRARGRASVPPAPEPSPPEPSPPAPAPLTRAAPPDPHHAVRAYGASLFTAGSPRRAYLEQLVATTRTPQPGPQIVSVVSGESGAGASTTAATVARTLATVREDLVALLQIELDPVDPTTMAAICATHAFAVIDIGSHVGEATPHALATSTRIVMVTTADRRASAAIRIALDRIGQVHPALVPDAVIAVVCRTGRQYRRVNRGLNNDRSPQAARIVPIPYDPGLPTMDWPDLARLQPATREAFLQLASTLTASTGRRPAAAGTRPAAAGTRPTAAASSTLASALAPPPPPAPPIPPTTFSL